MGKDGWWDKTSHLIICMKPWVWFKILSKQNSQIWDSRAFESFFVYYSVHTIQKLSWGQTLTWSCSLQQQACVHNKLKLNNSQTNITTWYVLGRVQPNRCFEVILHSLEETWTLCGTRIIPLKSEHLRYAAKCIYNSFVQFTALMKKHSHWHCFSWRMNSGTFIKTLSLQCNSRKGFFSWKKYRVNFPNRQQNYKYELHDSKLERSNLIDRTWVNQYELQICHSSVLGQFFFSFYELYWFSRLHGT